MRKSEEIGKSLTDDEQRRLRRTSGGIGMRGLKAIQKGKIFPRDKKD